MPLAIIEGANYVGKTSTITALKKKKSKWMFAYHPRFNNAQHFHFNYNVAETIKGIHVSDTLEKGPATIHVPRDVVYQISHMTCLKYLKTMHENHNIVLDRCFLSEMAYNELHDKQIYRSFVDVLKTFGDYKIFYLSVDSDDELKRRIEERLKADQEKKFGVRIDGTPTGETKVTSNEMVENRFKMQRGLDKRYRQELECSDLAVEFIDTSEIPQKEVAEKIIIGIKRK